MRFTVHETRTSIDFDPFGSPAAVMRGDSLPQTLRRPDVKRVRGSAKDVNEVHLEMLTRLVSWERPFGSLTLAQDYSTRVLYVFLHVCRTAARSVVMSEAMAESNGDPNGIRTRVTAVKGRCPRPLDDRVTKAGQYRIGASCCKLFAATWSNSSAFQRMAIESLEKIPESHRRCSVC